MQAIVSAADHRYWRSLYQFLQSAQRKGFAARYPFTAFDLGFDPDVRRRLEKRFSWCRFETFPFERFPPHVAMARRTYAWKVLIIEQMARQGGQLLWFDSATLFHTNDLEPIWRQIRANGVYVTKGQSSLEQHCDPLVLEAHSVPEATRKQPERVAGVMGFDCDNPAIRKLIDEWKALALDEAQIQPRNPPLIIHRWEQSLLTILLHRYEAEGLLRLPDAEIDISSSSPIRWMSSRNKVPTWMPTAADWFIRAYYRADKFVDQMHWRWRHARDQR